MRAHAAGLVGYYIPAMVVQHLIPRDRLNKEYFRRWFYWRGISRAMLYARTGLDMEAPEQIAARLLDGAAHRRRAALPVPQRARRGARRRSPATLRRDPVNAFEHELWLWMFAGIVKQRWHDRAAAGMPSEHRTCKQPG